MLALDQECESLFDNDQLENDPSPQSKRYCRVCPRVEVALVENDRLCPVSPLESPVGVLGVVTPSTGVTVGVGVGVTVVTLKLHVAVLEPSVAVTVLLPAERMELYLTQ